MYTVCLHSCATQLSRSGLRESDMRIASICWLFVGLFAFPLVPSLVGFTFAIPLAVVNSRLYLLNRHHIFTIIS
ncbi:hypothetical protein BDV06DRAFT_204502 [Aspergillus oleicola]